MRPTPEQERELLRGLIIGDEQAWRAFQRQYGRLLFRCIRRVTQRFPALLGPADEEEIYANLLLQLVARDRHKLRLFEIDRGHRLSTWLGMLASHAAYDHLRAARRAPTRVPLSEAEQTRATDASPYEAVERGQYRAIVDDILSSLSRKDRQFVALYFHRGLTPDAVAAALNISIKTVYSKKHKIRSRLEGLASCYRLAA
jgi:RNA polymerase sigma-70 factor (ECF subfamily)